MNFTNYAHYLLCLIMSQTGGITYIHVHMHIFRYAQVALLHVVQSGSQGNERGQSVGFPL
jgi:hypothetical protein